MCKEFSDGSWIIRAADGEILFGWTPGNAFAPAKEKMCMAFLEDTGGVIIG
jgi:hypothetical protein